MGHILCHDITQIIKDTKKDVVFKKGHIIREEDIDVLLSVGKRHLYVWENQPGMVHENDAAQVLYNMCKDEHMTGTPVKEGKIDLIALNDGLLKVDTKRLETINCLGEIIIATRHGNFPIKKGDKIAGTDFFPSSTASYPSSGCYAYNIYPAEGAANLPVLTLYFSGLAVNSAYTDADGNKAHFIGDKGFASVSRYRVAKAGLSDAAKTALCGASPVEIGSDYYQVVNFPAGYIYQVQGLSVTDEAVKTNPEGEGDELVATVVVTAWTIVNGSVDWK